MSSGADDTREELNEVVKATDEQAEYYVKEPEGDVKATRGGFVTVEPPDFKEGNIIDVVEEEVGGEDPGGSTPSQYGLPDGCIDLQDLIEHRDMNFAIGNIFKACYRMNNCGHSDLIRDVNKILWFAERELARLTK